MKKILSRLNWAGIDQNKNFQFAAYVMVIILMGNLNAMVDKIYHPEIPYISEEHVITGMMTGFVSTILFGVVLIYIDHLHQARETIKTLESFLPICSYCKKIRKPNSDPKSMESWQPLEAYFEERLDSQFSHGICPDCYNKVYRDYKGWQVSHRSGGAPLPQ